MRTVQLGALTITRTCADHLEGLGVSPFPFVNRHRRCDWGDLGADDKAANDRALVVGERILSRYNLSDGQALYVITEWDRSVTTVMLTSDY